MKNILATTIAVAGLVWAGSALASPMNFNVDGGPDSYVTLSNIDTKGWTGISASLDTGLSTMPDFILADGESEKFAFINVTTTSRYIGGIGSFDIAANLNFDDPGIDVGSSGSGSWGTLFGLVSGGTLSWGDTAIHTFELGGNTVQVALEEGCTIGLGTSATVHATVTNLGTTPVPEPSTLLIIGSGLIGLVGYNRKRFRKKGQLVF